MKLLSARSFATDKYGFSGALVSTFKDPASIQEVRAGPRCADGTRTRSPGRLWISVTARHCCERAG